MNEKNMETFSYELVDVSYTSHLRLSREKWILFLSWIVPISLAERVPNDYDTISMEVTYGT